MALISYPRGASDATTDAVNLLCECCTRIGTCPPRYCRLEGFFAPELAAERDILMTAADVRQYLGI